MSSHARILAIDIDPESLSASGPDAEHERRIAIFDLLENNKFALVNGSSGPYRLKLSLTENRLVFDIRDEADKTLHVHILSLNPFRGIIKDYFLICESYYEAIRNASPGQIEAIDMARRGIHNDGSDFLAERLKDKVEMDYDTTRRLFTLICALHARG